MKKIKVKPSKDFVPNYCARDYIKQADFKNSKLSSTMNTLIAAPELRTTILPLYDSNKIRVRHDTIERLIRAYNSDLRKDFKNCIKGIPDIFEILMAFSVKMTFDKNVFENIPQLLNTVINFQTSDEKNVSVQNGLNSELDYYKDLYGKIDLVLEEKLDFYLSLSHVAITRKYCKPELTKDIELDIEEGRHALYETLLDDETKYYVANNVFLKTAIDADNWEDDSERIMILTGADYSGKSVYTTQLALIIVMVQVGSFVPAKKAKCGTVDRLLTGVMTRETSSKTVSTFMIDCQQMSKCLRLYTKKSLSIIDEFGKGTDIYDGPGLFGSVIEYLLDKDNCPRVISAAHFEELFHLSNNKGTHHYHMEVFFSCDVDNTSFSDKKITYLYELTEGIAKRSFGITCAKMCGIKSEIIINAEKYFETIENGGSLKQLFDKMTNEEEEKIKYSKNVTKKFLESEVSELESKSNDELLKALEFN